MKMRVQLSHEIEWNYGDNIGGLMDVISVEFGRNNGGLRVRASPEIYKTYNGIL